MARRGTDLSVLVEFADPEVLRLAGESLTVPLEEVHFHECNDGVATLAQPVAVHVVARSLGDQAELDLAGFQDSLLEVLLAFSHDCLLGMDDVGYSKPAPLGCKNTIAKIWPFVKVK